MSGKSAKRARGKWTPKTPNPNAIPVAPPVVVKSRRREQAAVTRAFKALSLEEQQKMVERIAGRPVNGRMEVLNEETGKWETVEGIKTDSMDLRQHAAAEARK